MHRNIGESGEDDDIGTYPRGELVHIPRSVDTHFKNEQLWILMWMKRNECTIKNIFNPEEWIVPCIRKSEHGERYSYFRVKTLLTLANMCRSFEYFKNSILN